MDSRSDKITVRHVGKKESKAGAVLEGCVDKRPVLFVDDTVAELMADGIADNEMVHRVLFVRALL